MPSCERPRWSVFWQMGIHRKGKPMKHSLEYQVYRAKLNVKRATRRERPAAKRKLARLKRALALRQWTKLVVRAREFGIEPIQGETYRELQRRVYVAIAFAPRTGQKCEWKDGCYW